VYLSDLPWLLKNMLVEEGEAFIDFLPTDNTANELLGSRL